MRTHLFLILSFIAISLHGQDNKTDVRRSVNIREYITDVVQGNLGYIAEQFSVDMADAALRAARVFADPGLAVGYSDNQDEIMQLGRGVDAGISYNFSTGNIRSARIGVAATEKELAGLVLQQYFRDLRADAALVFFNSLKYKLLADVQTDTYQRMRELARADSIRFAAGTIMEVDARQSAIEARVQKGEAIRAESSWMTALVEVTRLTGSVRADTAYRPEGSLEFPIHDFQLARLMEQAMENHLDLQIAIQNRTLSEKLVRLVKAGRSLELGVETGLSYNTRAINEIAPSPPHYSFFMGLSVPLKFSSLNRGELQAAEMAVRQREVACRDAEEFIIAEVTRCFIEYQSQKRQLEEFHSGLLAEAETILENKIYSYQRGETGLLDVLNAQRTFNVIRQKFYETHYDYLAALIELERAAGIWDIE